MLKTLLKNLWFHAVEFWKAHKVGGTLIAIVLIMIIYFQIRDLINWIF